jgi:hypothetical protein
VSTVHNQFVVDNGKGGFDVHNLDSGGLLYSLDTGKPIQRVPKRALFAEESKTIVCGSDHGAVYIFGHKQSEPLQVLKHAEGGLVQAIAVRIFIFWRHLN